MENDVDQFDKYLNDDNLASLESESSTPSEGVQPEKETIQASPEQSIEEKLLGLKTEEKPVDENSDLLTKLNALGLTRNGDLIEYDSVDKVKEALMKWHDYTAKTQEVAQQRQAIEAEYKQKSDSFVQERQAFEKQRESVSAQILEHELFTDVLKELQATNPDVFNDLFARFNVRRSNYEQSVNNPVINDLKRQLRSLEEQTKSQVNQKEQDQVKTVLQDWEKGLSDIQSKYGRQLKSLNIVPDYKKVKEAWIAGYEKNTTPGQAFFSVYGEIVTKALEAQAKTQKQINQSLQRQGSSPKVAPQSQEEQAEPESRMSRLQKIAAKYAS